MRTVHLVSLGCAKNRVDSEVILGHLAKAGFAPSASPEAAELIVVNTCGFIDAAKEESIDTIAEMAEYKQVGACQTLVVAGCMSQRYAPELKAELPEVDHFLGTGNFEHIAEVISKGDGRPVLQTASSTQPLTRLNIVEQSPKAAHARLLARDRLRPFAHPQTAGIDVPDPDFTLTAQSPRLLTGPAFSTYLKVSEGCSNTCAFCIIPRLRGPQRSRAIDDVVAEAAQLMQRGAFEINLLAQNLCAFGLDLRPRQTLADLLYALDDLATAHKTKLWLRCLYAYPKGLTQHVRRALSQCTNVVPYLDMPLQHISDPMLRRMRRGAGGASTRRLISQLRLEVPDIVLRTTFIAGLPGETEADFAELLNFVNEARFERMGAFVYSREEGTPAADMADQVPRKVAQKRAEALLKAQAKISRAHNHQMLGKVVDVLVEGISDQSEWLLVGRHRGQAPEVDGVTYITDGTAQPGDVVRVQIEQAGDFDVAGPIVKDVQFGNAEAASAQRPVGHAAQTPHVVMHGAAAG